MTSGRASYTMEFSHYEPVPHLVAEEVIAEVAKARAAAQHRHAGRIIGLRFTIYFNRLSTSTRNRTLSRSS